MEPIEVLTIIISIWILAYFISKILPLKKRNIQFTPLFLMYRTEKLNIFLRNSASKYRRFWKTFSTIGILVSVVEIILAVQYLGNNLYRFLYVPQEAGPVIPVILGITISPRWFPYLLVAIGLAITIHELSHGIVAFLEKIPIRSSGIILAPITFGGFVEPDEGEFNKAPLVSKLRIISAGSLSNMIAGLLSMLLLLTLFLPSSGILVLDVPDENPAYQAGIRPWDVIYSINGSRVQNWIELQLYMLNVEPNTPLIIETSNGFRSVQTKASPENASRGIIGVRDLRDYYPLKIGEFNTQFSHHFFWTLTWINVLMINLAIFNMLPLFPLDGEQFIYAILGSKFKRIKPIRIFISSIFFALFVLNVGLSLLKYGLTPI